MLFALHVECRRTNWFLRRPDDLSWWFFVEIRVYIRQNRDTDTARVPGSIAADNQNYGLAKRHRDGRRALVGVAGHGPISVSSDKCNWIREIPVPEGSSENERPPDRRGKRYSPADRRFERRDCRLSNPSRTRFEPTSGVDTPPLFRCRYSRQER